MVVALPANSSSLAVAKAQPQRTSQHHCSCVRRHLATTHELRFVRSDTLTPSIDGAGLRGTPSAARTGPKRLSGVPSCLGGMSKNTFCLKLPANLLGWLSLPLKSVVRVVYGQF